ncbi:MAG: hypothetical protein R3181_14615 [Rubricoccaceae bacterium]|nr:hypothetical protein [Rubricoccaceae bacterium]
MMKPPLYLALALLAALPAGAQDPEEFPGLLVVSAPPEEAGEFIAGVCDAAHCLLLPPQGVGPYRLVPGRDPGLPDANPPVGPDRGCDWFTNADEIAGNFVLIRAGGCNNLDKFTNAWFNDALGVVLYHDETVGADDDSTLANIEWKFHVLLPVYGLFVSRYRGERLLAAHDAGHEVVAEMRMTPDVVAAEPPAATQPFALSVSPNPTLGGAAVRVAADRPLVDARLSVLDGLGREVAVLHAGPLPAGPSTFRLPAGLRSGVSLVRLAADGAVVTRRAVVLR